MSEEQFGYTFRTQRTCDVVNAGCLAPPSFASSHTRSTCYRCGNPVCTNCSRVRPYLRFGRRRICDNCSADIKREKP